MADQEQVLVAETSVIENLGLFHGLESDVDRYLSDLFTPGTLSFKPRPEMETDPSHKQLIPYVLMECNGKYLNYVRGKRAGETRLVAKRSMGIGGHINPVDASAPLSDVDLKDVYYAAVQREIEEEVNVNTNHTDNIVALLNDDTNEVGKVHLGVVHLWKLDSEDVTRNEQMITQLTFSTIDELNAVKDTMETWSQLCLEALEKM